MESSPCSIASLSKMPEPPDAEGAAEGAVVVARPDFGNVAGSPDAVPQAAATEAAR